MIENTALRSSVDRLMPDRTPEEALAILLLDEARRSLMKYRTMDRRFQEKYQTTFAEFRQKVVGADTSFEEEQDYFDWELAVTGIEEMEEEIRNLEALA
jgi:hypothetical protein